LVLIDDPSGLSVTAVAETVRLALAPVFLLSGIGAFLNVCVGRLSRIVDRSRHIEPLLLASRGAEHDRWIAELRVLDRRMNLVSWVTALAVLSALLTCLVVALLFAASLTETHFGNAIALLFIGAMLSIGAGFAVFLIETRIGARAVRVRSDLLRHRVDEGE
jgi:hypothetical protein